MTRLQPDQHCEDCGGQLVPPHIVDGKRSHDADYICVRCRRAYRWTMDNPPRLIAIHVERSEGDRE